MLKMVWGQRWQNQTWANGLIHSSLPPPPPVQASKRIQETPVWKQIKFANLHFTERKLRTREVQGTRGRWLTPKVSLGLFCVFPVCKALENIPLKCVSKCPVCSGVWWGLSVSQFPNWPHIWWTERLPTPVFWPGEFHGLYSPWGRRVRHDWATFTHSLGWDTADGYTGGCPYFLNASTTHGRGSQSFPLQPPPAPPLPPLAALKHTQFPQGWERRLRLNKWYSLLICF